MPPPRLRFTVRRLMFAAAIVAIILGGVAWCAKMYHLSRYYYVRSAYYELRYDANPKNPSSKVQEWELRMMLKYQHLTLFPWSSVEPDEPEPK